MHDVNADSAPDSIPRWSAASAILWLTLGLRKITDL
jgi:hypothetical protein